jgi:hypothetical protein
MEVGATVTPSVQVDATDVAKPEQRSFNFSVV